MKKLLLSGIAFALLAVGPALAADLPRKAPAYQPPPPPPPLTWTGCYIGANIGGAFGRFKVETPFGEESRDGSGFAGGGQIGCDYQFAGGWVIGFRNMFDGTTNNRDRTIEHGPLAGDVISFHNRWFDTLTGRVGYAVQPAWLLYFQGGAVWSRVEADLTTFDGFEVASWSNTKTGWTIGGGVEWMFAPHWSAFLEGNYMDFGSRDRTVFTPVACPVGCDLSTKATAATVLVGVNYRFW